VIYVGIDDTDVPGTPGTNQLARALAADLADRYRCAVIVRHQLLQDPRVPCTSKNSAASMLLAPSNGSALEPLVRQLQAFLCRRFVEGSDPGLCVTATVPEPITAFARRCQRELVTQEEARRFAVQHGVHLEGFGGTEDGVIGALAAVGLVAEGNDGRVVQIGAWPDDLTGRQDIETLRVRGVEVRCLQRGTPVRSGTVDVGKHLRPNYRQHRIVLFVQPAPGERHGTSRWCAVRLT
jgi:hypothetical protein